MSISLLPHAVIKVSSVLNKESKQYGKAFMFDDKSDTCWNSDQGTPQWIHLDFTKVIQPKEIHIQFQGGFAGKDCSVEVQLEGQNEITKIQQFYPEDINSLQVFPITADIPGEWTPKNMRIIFNNSTDFFGRVIIYKLDLIGEMQPCL